MTVLSYFLDLIASFHLFRKQAHQKKADEERKLEREREKVIFLTFLSLLLSSDEFFIHVTGVVNQFFD